ncbi:hypothetical protein [Sporosarcina ureae]|uniref:hypothetical protein n=1 Tax=Sporosarcina ureae TaxID=1571 RepID=UPI0009DC750C|nr:hypothetical protein [Sporosarcina ureae]ARF18563.1 hypothetical protein SporoP17a_15470 [Sporosarcina ureae]
MDINIGLVALIVLIFGLLLVVFGQHRQINALKQQNQKILAYEPKDKLVALTKQKLQTLGDVKTVKFLRQEKGMSMVDAKKLVDSVQGER